MKLPLFCVMQSKIQEDTRVMTRMLTATYGESVSSIPFLDNGPPIGPILNGTKYMVRPFIHPGNLSLTASCNAFGLIQWPRVPMMEQKHSQGEVFSKNLSNHLFGDLFFNFGDMAD